MRDKKLTILETIQVLSPLFHLLTLRTPVVVLFDHSLADVRAVADYLVRHVAVQTMGNATPPDCMGTHA